MSNARLNLVVIRSADIERAAECYRALGLEFVKHRHGKGLEHFACEQDGMVFEIYPGEGTISTRLGFFVECIDEAMILWEIAGGSLYSKPEITDGFYRAVMIDPDGHKVELIAPRVYPERK